MCTSLAPTARRLIVCSIISPVASLQARHFVEIMFCSILRDLFACMIVLGLVVGEAGAEALRVWSYARIHAMCRHTSKIPSGNESVHVWITRSKRFPNRVGSTSVRPYSRH